MVDSLNARLNPTARLQTNPVEERNVEARRANTATSSNPVNRPAASDDTVRGSRELAANGSRTANVGKTPQSAKPADASGGGMDLEALMMMVEDAMKKAGEAAQQAKQKQAAQQGGGGGGGGEGGGCGGGGGGGGCGGAGQGGEQAGAANGANQPAANGANQPAANGANQPAANGANQPAANGANGATPTPTPAGNNLGPTDSAQAPAANNAQSPVARAAAMQQAGQQMVQQSQQKLDAAEKKVPQDSPLRQMSSEKLAQEKPSENVANELGRRAAAANHDATRAGVNMMKDLSQMKPDPKTGELSAKDKQSLAMAKKDVVASKEKADKFAGAEKDMRAQLAQRPANTNTERPVDAANAANKKKETTATPTPTPATPAANAPLTSEQANAAADAVHAAAGNDPTKLNSASGVFKALEGKSPAQIKQVEDAYNAKHGEGAFDKNVRGNMHTWNREAMDHLRNGNTQSFDAARTAGAQKDKEVNDGTRRADFREPTNATNPNRALSQGEVNNAVTQLQEHIGNDPSQINSASGIFRALEGMSPSQIKQVDAALKEKTGKGLDDARANMHSWNKEAMDSLRGGNAQAFHAQREAGAARDQEVLRGERQPDFSDPRAAFVGPPAPTPSPTDATPAPTPSPTPPAPTPPQQGGGGGGQPPQQGGGGGQPPRASGLAVPPMMTPSFPPTQQRRPVVQPPRVPSTQPPPVRQQQPVLPPTTQPVRPPSTQPPTVQPQPQPARPPRPTQPPVVRVPRPSVPTPGPGLVGGRRPPRPGTPVRPNDPYGGRFGHGPIPAPVHGPGPIGGHGPRPGGVRGGRRH